VQLVTENTAFSGDTNMASPKDRLKDLTNQYQAHAVLAESAGVDRKSLDSVLLDLSTTVASLVKEDGTLASAADFLQGQISETRRKLAQPAPVVEKKKCDDDDDDDDMDKKSKKDEASDDTDDADGEEISEVDELEYVRGLLVAANEELKAKDEVINSLTEALEQQEKELEEALASVDAATKTLAEMTAAADPKAKALKEAIETSIRENTNLEPLRAILESQKDIESVKKIAEAVAKPAGETKPVSESRTDLPNKDVKSTNESQKSDSTASAAADKPKVFSIVESIAKKRAGTLGGSLRTAASDRR
jgi:ABC-type transporter Mla subunit MlaD